MKIGLIGAGRVATAFSRYALAAGHEVLLSNSRGPDSLKTVISKLGGGARAVPVAEAGKAPVVVLAVPWRHVEDALRPMQGSWNRRILIDATNHFIGADGELANLHGQISSQIVARLAPDASVVKAVNNLFVERFEAGPIVNGARRVTFVSGDDAAAKATVESILRGFGFAVIDLGGLGDGGQMQQAGGPLAGVDILRHGLA